MMGEDGAPIVALWKRNDGNEDASKGSHMDSNPNQNNYQELWKKYAHPCPDPHSCLHYVAKTLVVVQEISLSIAFVQMYQMCLQQEQLQRAQSQATTRAERQYILQNLLTNQYRFDVAAGILVAALILVVVLLNTKKQHERGDDRQSLQNKARQRLTDACLIGILLRFLANLLCSLTASYADDSVESLALACMILHILTCDYAYANGEPKLSTTRDKIATISLASSNKSKSSLSVNNRRPPFEGGTLSLNAVFFATLLLISRLSQNDEQNQVDGNNNVTTTAYVFCMLAVVIFAFYPLTRHELSMAYPPTQSPVVAIVTTLLFASTVILCGLPIGSDDPNMADQSNHDNLQHQFSSTSPLSLVYQYTDLVFCLLVVIPLWKYSLQFNKVLLRGPWDIPSADSLLYSSNDVEPSRKHA